MRQLSLNLEARLWTLGEANTMEVVVSGTSAILRATKVGCKWHSFSKVTVPQLSIVREVVRRPATNMHEWGWSWTVANASLPHAVPKKLE